MGNILDGCRPPDAQTLITGMFCNENTQAGAGAYSSDSWCQSPQHEITKVKRFAKSRHSSRPKGGEVGVYYKHLLAATKAGFSIEQAKKVVDKPKSAITPPRRVSSEWETSTPQVFRCAQIPAAVGRPPRERSQDRRAMLPPIEPSPRGRVREEPEELSIERGNRSQFQDEVSLDASNREFGDALEALNPQRRGEEPRGESDHDSTGEVQEPIVEDLRRRKNREIPRFPRSYAGDHPLYAGTLGREAAVVRTIPMSSCPRADTKCRTQWSLLRP